MKRWGGVKEGRWGLNCACNWCGFAKKPSGKIAQNYSFVVVSVVLVVVVVVVIEMVCDMWHKCHMIEMRKSDKWLSVRIRIGSGRNAV